MSGRKTKVETDDESSVMQVRAGSEIPPPCPMVPSAGNNKEKEPNVSETECGGQPTERSPVLNILDIPPEMLFSIFRKLDHASVAKCARVCKKFNDLSKDPILFRKVTLPFPNDAPTRYEKWVLERATNPKTVSVFEVKSTGLLIGKLGTWHNLEYLTVQYLALEDVDGGPLKMLRSISLICCRFNCKALKEKLKHSSGICKLEFFKNNCSHCREECNTGILSLIDLVPCVEHLVEVSILNRTDIIQKDLHLLSVCASLKRLELGACLETLHDKEATLAMEIVAKKCTKLERVLFYNLGYVTDSVLEILSGNCKKLNYLKLEQLSNITVKSCVKAVNSLPQLQTWYVMYCPLVTPSCAETLRGAIAMVERRSSTTTPTKIEFVYSFD